MSDLWLAVGIGLSWIAVFQSPPFPAKLFVLFGLCAWFITVMFLVVKADNDERKADTERARAKIDARIKANPSYLHSIRRITFTDGEGQFWTVPSGKKGKHERA